MTSLAPTLTLVAAGGGQPVAQPLAGTGMIIGTVAATLVAGAVIFLLLVHASRASAGGAERRSREGATPRAEPGLERMEGAG
jgi:hypothetical protein